MAFFSKKEPSAKDDKASNAKGVKAAAAPVASAPRANGVPAPASTGGAGAIATDANLKMELERSRRTLASLGEIVSVLMRTPEFQSVNLAALRAIVTPAISSGQFLTLTARRKESGSMAPMALAMWAMVSPEVDQRLAKGTGGADGLKPGEWTSGDIPWLVVLAGDKTTAPMLVSRLQQTTLKGKTIKVFAKDDAGKPVIRTIPPQGAKA